jgi:hypothetical protein
MQHVKKKLPILNVRYHSVELNTSLNDNIGSSSDFNLDINQIVILLVILKEYPLLFIMTIQLTAYQLTVEHTTHVST